MDKQEKSPRGEAVPLPTRLTFRNVSSEMLPRSEAIGDRTVEAEPGISFVQAVIDRWRGATSDRGLRDDAVGPVSTEPQAAHVEDRIDQLRTQLLRR